MSDSEYEANLRAAIAMMVPIAVEELQYLSTASRLELPPQDAEILAKRVAELFRRPQRKMGKNVVGRIAFSIAALAFEPGGFDIQGIHACVEGHEECPAGNVSTETESPVGHVLVLPNA